MTCTMLLLRSLKRLTGSMIDSLSMQLEIIWMEQIQRNDETYTRQSGERNNENPFYRYKTRYS